ncbi:MAG: CRISPR-associated protein Cas4 [Methylobacter sp.]|nr:CRISPR-associated protein Cas4 [Methylobacter sp.]
MEMTLPEPPDKIPLSALNQYAYCPRRCYLIHAEGEFTDNIHTQSGTLEHERVDQLAHEIKKGVRVEFALPVWSDLLGISGRCDAVEFHPDGSVFPIEYKHGKRKQWDNGDIQVAAQAMCLEEMLKTSIPAAAVYHIQTRRRREVAIDQALRNTVAITVKAVVDLLNSQQCPPPTEHIKRCPQCSLNSLCNPELLHEKTRLQQLSAQLFNIESDA